MGNLPKANKNLGQHFLTDKSIIEAITSDYSSDADCIFEVGPGPAVLTRYLGSLNKPLYLFEMDQRFEDLLQASNPIDIIWGDALKQNWKEFCQHRNLHTKKNWMVSNLPYNVSAPLLISFIRSGAFEFMTLMFQKEVGIKSLLREDVKMSSLTALCNTYFETKLLKNVLPGAFSPPPKVNSIVISYRKITSPVISLCEFSQFENFLKTVFGQKRKQLRKVLADSYGSDTAMEVLNKTELKPQIRAEVLTLKQVQNLYLNFKSL